MRRPLAAALVLCTLAAACALAAGSAAPPERVEPMRKKYLSPERYRQLRDEWKAYAESHPNHEADPPRPAPRSESAQSDALLIHARRVRASDSAAGGSALHSAAVTGSPRPHESPPDRSAADR